MSVEFRQRARALLGNWFVSTALLVLVVFSFRSAVADWNDVPTGSMKPTILIGDRIFVNKLAYDLRLPFTNLRLATWSQPARGDIVICWSPADGSRLVKRVVAVPGDTIELRNGRIRLNGKPLDYKPTPESPAIAAMGDDASDKVFLLEDLPGHPHIVALTPGQAARRDFGPVTLGDGEFFMMGDNRDNSADSRYFGFVERDAVVGRVEGIALSLDYEHSYRPRWSRFLSDIN